MQMQPMGLKATQMHPVGMDTTVDTTKTIDTCQKTMKMCSLPVEPKETRPGQVQEPCKHAKHMQTIT